MKTVIKTPKTNQPNKPSLWVFKKIGTGYPVPDEVREFNNQNNQTNDSTRTLPVHSG